MSMAQVIMDNALLASIELAGIEVIEDRPAAALKELQRLAVNPRSQIVIDQAIDDFANGEIRTSALSAAALKAALIYFPDMDVEWDRQERSLRLDAAFTPEQIESLPGDYRDGANLTLTGN